MSEQPLQFERAEFSGGASAVVCSVCDQSVVQSYYELGGKIICSPCREKQEQALEGWGLVRFLRASAAGFAAAAVSAVVWYGVRKLTDAEWGILAIGVGYVVGKAVHWGSRGKGGWLYQLLAVFLTYTGIVTNWIPEIVESVRDGAPATALTYVIAFFASYTVPFYAGLANFVGDIIILIGLLEAWKFNKRADAGAMTGPYTVTPAAPPVANA